MARVPLSAVSGLTRIAIPRVCIFQHVEHNALKLNGGLTENRTPNNGSTIHSYNRLTMSPFLAPETGLEPVAAYATD